jgi:hypothetical protein
VNVLEVADLTPLTFRTPSIAAGLDALLSERVFATFERAPADARACQMRLAVAYMLMRNKAPIASAEAGEAHAILEGELTCPAGYAPHGTQGFRTRLELDRPFGGLAGGHGDSRLREVLSEIVTDGVDVLYGQVRARGATDAELRDHLAHATHPGLLGESSSEAGERHLVDTVPDLVRLTAHANRRVAMRASAALGQLGLATPEVIAALVHMTEGPDAEAHLIAIHALGDLGTPEARRYLGSLAESHPSPTLRKVARERLAPAEP